MYRAKELVSPRLLLDSPLQSTGLCSYSSPRLLSPTEGK